MQGSFAYKAPAAWIDDTYPKYNKRVGAIVLGSLVAAPLLGLWFQGGWIIGVSVAGVFIVGHAFYHWNRTGQVEQVKKQYFHDLHELPGKFMCEEKRRRKRKEAHKDFM